MRSEGMTGFMMMGLSLLILGLALREWVFISLLLPIVLYVGASYLLFQGHELQISLTRTSDLSRTTEESEVQVTLSIKNDGGRSRIRVRDLLPEGAPLVQGANHLMLSLNEGEEAELSYVVRFPRRGRYEIGPTRIEWRDPSLLFHKSLELGGTTAVKVFPLLERIRKSRLSPTKVRTPMGNVSSKFTGPGTEFYSLREYVPGDEIRFINWKATARMDSLIMNEYESDRSGDVTLILDAGVGSDQGDGLLLDRLTRAAASISENILARRHRVGMVILGEYVDTVRPGYGRRQFDRINDHLLLVGPGDTRSMRDTVRALRRFFPLESQIVMITPLQDRGVLEAVRFLQRRGHQLVVISPSPIKAELSEMVPMRSSTLAGRLMALERENLISELYKHCPVIDWNYDHPLEGYLSEVRPFRRVGQRT